MKELFRSTDPVRISHAVALLEAEDIPTFELDQHMSVLEGSIGVLPRRLMVADQIGRPENQWEADWPCRTSCSRRE